MQQTLQRKALLYDKSGEEHYNLISALHKSMRNSDADATVYWLARMVEAGEDPLYIARRLVRFASEDIGNADPQALVTQLILANAMGEAQAKKEAAAMAPLTENANRNQAASRRFAPLRR